MRQKKLFFWQLISINLGVDIYVPHKSSNSNLTTIVGQKDAVQKCRSDLLNIIAQQKNNKSLVLQIPHKFHAQIITEYIPKLIEKFPYVSVTFPDAKDSLIDEISFYGYPEYVDTMSQELARLAAMLTYEHVSFDIVIVTSQFF